MTYQAKPNDAPVKNKRELRCPICQTKYGEHYKGLVVLNCTKCNQISVLDSEDSFNVG